MPLVTVYDNESGRTVAVDSGEVDAGVKSGKYSTDSGTVARENLNGTEVARTPGQAQLSEAAGADWSSGAQAALTQRQEQHQEAITGIDDKVRAFADGLVDAVTLGVVRSHDSVTMEQREANPGSTFLGEVLGGVTTMGVGAGKSLVKGGEAIGKSIAKQVIKEGEGRLAKAGARAIQEAATGAVITGTMATTHQLGDAIIENKPLSAAAWAHEVGFGTLLAGSIGVAAGALSRGGATRAAVKGQGGLLDSASADSAAVHAAVEDTVGTYGQHLEALANKHGIMTAIDQETGLLSRGAMAERGAALKEAGKAYQRLKSIKLDKALDNEAKFAEWQSAHDDFYAKFQALDDKMNITPGEADSYSAARQADIGNTPGMAPGMRPRKFGENPVQRSPGSPQENQFNVNTMDVRRLNIGIKQDIQMAGQQAEAENASSRLAQIKHEQGAIQSQHTNFDSVPYEHPDVRKWFDLQAEAESLQGRGVGPGDKYKQIYGEDWQPSISDDIRDAAERKAAGIESGPARAVTRQGADEATGVLKAVTPADLQAEGVQLGRQAVKQGDGEAIGVLNAVKPVETQEVAGEAFQRFMTEQTNKVEPQWGYDGVWKPELVGVKDRQMGKLADRYRATERMDAQHPLDSLPDYADDATGEVGPFLRSQANRKVLAGLNERGGKVDFSPMDRELAAEGGATINELLKGGGRANQAAKAALDARSISPSMADIEALKNPKLLTGEADSISSLIADRRLAVNGNPALAQRDSISNLIKERRGLVEPGASKTQVSMAAQENAAIDSAKAGEAKTAAGKEKSDLSASYENDSISGMIGKRRQAMANREPAPDLKPKSQPYGKPEKAVIRWMEDWHAESQQMGPRLSPFQKASEKAREAIEAINSKHGARLDAAGGLNPQELFGLPRSTTALGERMQQLFTLRQAGKMVASASRGGKVPAAASKSASTWLQRNLAGRIGAKLMGGIAGGALGGPIGFAIGASMMAGGAGSIGRVAGAAGRLTAKIGEATEKLLSGKVGKALAPSVTNQAFAYDSDGPIKDLSDRIEKINALAANPDAVRQKVMASFGDLAYISPELAQAAADHAINKLQMLKMRMPMFMYDSLGRPMQLSESKQRKACEYEQAANDLDICLDGLKNGTLTRCQADAFRECWPEVHSEVIKPLLTQKDKYAKLNDVGKRQIEMVLGGPVFSNPGDVIRHQQMWQQANQQAPAQQLAGQGKVQALNISETPAQSSMAPGNN